MKILFLTTILLSKNCNGGEVASQCFIDALKSLGHQVTVVGYLRKGDRFEHNSKETFVVDERHTETRKSKFYALLWLALSLWKSLPYSSAKYYSHAYINLINKIIFSEKYDSIIIEHAQIGWIEAYIQDKNQIIFISQNVEHEMYEEQFKRANNLISKLLYKREARLMKLQEARLSSLSQQIWTLTDHDHKSFAHLANVNRIRTFGIAPSFKNLQEKIVKKHFDIGILGSWTWKPNIEGLKWFIENVYSYLPVELSIHVAGKDADWLNGKYPNIYYCGVVPDAQEFMAQAKVVAIPTLSGGGIQIKTLDAIASGSLIVATPIALRGITHPPSTVRVAETPQEFANLIMSAVTSTSTSTTFDNAKNWYRSRREQFLNDLASAVSST
ncbi:glycosyltransferase family 4 protein [Chlorogloeopsis sp. ULAP02]|uniref:glycosyltransferase n=1 Tax=Chlorogloeopsis sp. ULAP02 TaxID=3107926 RepID=UPI0031363F32